MSEWEALYACLTREAADAVRNLAPKELEMLEEIRFYLGRPAEMMIGGRRRQTGVVAGEKEMGDLLAALSGQALYRCEAQMAEGYIPLPGGHRAGVCGRMVRQADGLWRMSGVTSVCIRIARSVRDASRPVRRHLLAPDGRVRSALLLGAPGCGKTTVLRDAALFLAERVHVAVADEREELFGGEAARHEPGMDVMRGSDKARAFVMLIRSMAPQVIVCDELGRPEDADAALDAARCGVSVIASAHAQGFRDLLARPALRRLFDAGAFERYIHLGKRGCVLGAWDGSGRMIDGEEAEYGELGCGDDGNDWRQRRGLSAFGR